MGKNLYSNKYSVSIFPKLCGILLDVNILSDYSIFFVNFFLKYLVQIFGEIIQ